MEKRLILAIVLSFLVLFGYQALFVKPQKPLPPQPAPAAVEAAARVPGAVTAAPEQTKTAETKLAPVASAETTPIVSKDQETIVIETDLYRAAWSNQGGVLTSWALKKHKSYEKENLELVAAMAGSPGFPYPFTLRVGDKALDDLLNGNNYRLECDPPAVDGTVKPLPGGSAELRFTYAEAGLRAEKVFRFKGGVYPIEIEIRVWKDGLPIPASFLWGPGLGRFSEKEQKIRSSTMGGTAVSGAVFYANGRPRRLPEKGYKPDYASPSYLNWAAYEDQYFTALFVFPGRLGQAAFINEAPAGQAGFYLSVEASSPASPSGNLLGYIGPKETEALVAFGHGTKAVIRYSKFLGLDLKPIAEIMLSGVKICHRIVPNWGLAIILLTIVIKILFFPLTYSSTKSMAKMAEIQPKVKALRAKYKKSKTDIEQRRQMNEEMMKLYKEQGINPAGGCLPLLIQLPVFVAVYQMLATAIEFRNSPFIPFWINDLSVRDKTFILPVMMGGTQLITQKMTPTSADPAQAKMMMIMPIIMTFFFAMAQSGLVLYWLTTNVLQIGQQALINHMMARQRKMPMENENKPDNGQPVDERPEYKGPNLEEAISLAEHRLKLPREKFNYEIVTEKTRLFGSKEIVIRAWPKDEGGDAAAEKFLERFLEVFPLELTFQVKKRPDIVFVIFDGPDKTILLRNDGSLLLAIQHVLNKLSKVKVQVDCEFYRKRKEKKLREYAQRIARQVSDSGREEILEQMNPYERRIVHIVANETPGVTSESIGEGFLKKVKVFRAQR